MSILKLHLGDDLHGFDARVFAAHRADIHLCDAEGRARCSLWWREVPAYQNERLGVIGHFESRDFETGLAVLREAVAVLKERGCTLAVGPMDGNTWRRYRAVTFRGTEPPFFMEPDTPDDWPRLFESAGFQTLATYCSDIATDLEKRDPRALRATERFVSAGVIFRDLNPAAFEEDLRRIYRVSRVSFVHNFLYMEISEDEFVQQYLPYRDKIDPRLVLIAEQGGEVVGFLFGIPDVAEAMRGEPIRTVIGKTLAILPQRQFGGLGVVLVDLLHQRACELGYKRVIHALQNEANPVCNISRITGTLMRKYALYCTPIEK